ADAGVKAAAQWSGVSRVLVADAPQFEKATAEILAALLMSVIRDSGYTHILAPATAFGKNVLPRVAAMLDVAQISDITAIEGPDTFVRPIYAGNAFATVQSKDPIKVITVRTTAFDAATNGGSARIESIAAPADVARTKVVREELTASARPELTSARIVISGGRGLGSGANFKLLEALADKLNAAIGASRAAVDAGYVPNDYQVGQTGKIVAPDLYIAIGISRSIQRLRVQMRWGETSRTRSSTHCIPQHVHAVRALACGLSAVDVDTLLALRQGTLNEGAASCDDFSDASQANEGASPGRRHVR